MLGTFLVPKVCGHVRKTCPHGEPFVVATTARSTNAGGTPAALLSVFTNDAVIVGTIAVIFELRPVRDASR